MSAHVGQLNALNTASTSHPSPEDLAQYAMQLFGAAETASLTEHLTKCAQCREGLARLYDDIAAFALTAEDAAPSPTSRQRLLAQIAREKKIVFSLGETRPEHETRPEIPAVAPLNPPEPQTPSQPPEAPPQYPEPSRKPVMWAGWSIAACLGITAGFMAYGHLELSDTLSQRNGQLARLNKDAASSHQLLDALTDPQATRTTLTPPSKLRSGPIAEVTYNAEKGTLILLASNLDPIRIYKTYQLWLIPTDGSAAIPAGTFHPDDHGGANIILPTIPKGIPAKEFGVTIEDAGGSHKPTPPFILSGSNATASGS